MDKEEFEKFTKGISAVTDICAYVVKYGLRALMFIRTKGLWDEFIIFDAEEEINENQDGKN